jgi:hypothetical protein
MTYPPDNISATAPLIFLDVDGVLNWMRSFEPCSGPPVQFEPPCVRAFNHIIEETAAQIVLSSSWRYLILNGHMSLNGFSVLLRSHGVRGWLIGHTRADASDSEPRYMQIADWLSFSGRNGRKFLILDDDPQAFGHMPGIQTASRDGLTAENAIEAVRLLKE